MSKNKTPYELYQDWQTYWIRPLIEALNELNFLANKIVSDFKDKSCGKSYKDLSGIREIYKLTTDRLLVLMDDIVRKFKSDEDIVNKGIEYRYKDDEDYDE